MSGLTGDDGSWMTALATHTWLEIFVGVALAVLLAGFAFAMLNCFVNRHRPPNDWGR